MLPCSFFRVVCLATNISLTCCATPNFFSLVYSLCEDTNSPEPLPKPIAKRDLHNEQKQKDVYVIYENNKNISLMNHPFRYLSMIKILKFRPQSNYDSKADLPSITLHCGRCSAEFLKHGRKLVIFLRSKIKFPL